MFTIDNINVEPNKRWFIVLSNSVGGIYVRLYLSAEDASTDTNKIAEGTSSGFGVNLELALTQVAASQLISFFNSEIPWHCVVSGESGDTTKTYQVGPFTDLSPINHAVYRNRDIIYYRAAAVIDAATHLDTLTTINSPRILTSLNPGDSVRVNSDELNVDRYLFTKAVEYQLTPNSMTTTITASKFDRVTR